MGQEEEFLPAASKGSCPSGSSESDQHLCVCVCVILRAVLQLCVGLLGVWDPPDGSGSAHEPGLSVAGRTNVPGAVTEPRGGPKPGPPALPGQGGVVG